MPPVPEITYTELVRRIPLGVYAENTDLVAEMPVIIRKAEEMLAGRVDHDFLQTTITGKSIGNATVNPSGGDDDLDLSAESPRVLEVRSIRIKHRGRATQWVPVHRREINFLRTLYSMNTPGVPRYYGEDKGVLNLVFFPYPNALYDLEITANKVPAFLTSGNQTNAFTIHCPRALEWACMHFAALFMKDFTAAQGYSSDVDNALTEANMLGARRRRDEGAQRPQETANAQGR